MTPAIHAVDLGALSPSEITRPSEPSLGVVDAGAAIRAGDEGSVDSFEHVLMGAVEQANRADSIASQKEQALASGAIDDLHGTMISVKEADISIRLVGTVRNKILDAFQELWRTSV